MSEPAQGGKSERRTTGRHARSMKVPCSAKRILQEGPWEALVISLSVSQVRLLAGQPLQPGAFVSVDLPDRQNRAKERLVRLTVVRPRARGTGWSYTGSFVKPLGEDEVARLLPRMPLAAPTGRRQTRVPGAHGLATRFRRVIVTEDGPWLVTMQNVSRTGIGFTADRAFEPGMHLKVELPGIRRKRLRPRLVRVLHAKPLPGGAEWQMGGIFLRDLNEDELRALL